MIERIFSLVNQLVIANPNIDPRQLIILLDSLQKNTEFEVITIPKIKKNPIKKPYQELRNFLHQDTDSTKNLNKQFWLQRSINLLKQWYEYISPKHTPAIFSSTDNLAQYMVEISNIERPAHIDDWLDFEAHLKADDSELVPFQHWLVNELRKQQITENRSLVWFVRNVYYAVLNEKQRQLFLNYFPGYQDWFDFENTLTHERVGQVIDVAIPAGDLGSTTDSYRKIYQELNVGEKEIFEKLYPQLAQLFNMESVLGIEPRQIAQIDNMLLKSDPRAPIDYINRNYETWSRILTTEQQELNLNLNDQMATRERSSSNSRVVTYGLETRRRSSGDEVRPRIFFPRKIEKREKTYTDEQETIIRKYVLEAFRKIPQLDNSKPLWCGKYDNRTDLLQRSNGDGYLINVLLIPPIPNISTELIIEWLQNHGITENNYFLGDRNIYTARTGRSWYVVPSGSRENTIGVVGVPMVCLRDKLLREEKHNNVNEGAESKWEVVARNAGTASPTQMAPNETSSSSSELNGNGKRIFNSPGTPGTRKHRIFEALKRESKIRIVVLSDCAPDEPSTTISPIKT